MSVQITNVMAVSLDGRIGKHALESDSQRRVYNFTNEDDRNWVRQQLTNADAVVTGANSLRASGSAWDVQNDKGVNPAWIVLSKAGLDESLPFWTQKNIMRALVSPFEVQSNHCLEKGVEHWLFGEENPARYIVRRLEEKNLTRVLLFGGGAVNNLFYEEGLVDFAKITLCPLIIGALSSPNFVNPGLTRDVNMTLVSSVVKGSLIFLTYKIQK